MATDRLEIIITAHGTRTVQRQIAGIGKSAGVTRKALAFMRAALVVFASVQIIRKLLDVADAFTIMRNRLKLITGSMAELNTVQNALFKLSRQTRTSFEANATLFSRMARATLKLKLTFGELLEVTRATALAVKISGAETQEAKSAMIQFSQGLAAGALAGDELRSVVEQLPRLADAIGRAFKKTGGELRAFNKANPGILKTELIVKALRDELALLGPEFKKTVPTIAEGFVILQDSITLFIGRVNLATGAGRVFSNFLISIADNIDRVVLALLALGAVIAVNIIIGQLAILSTTIVKLGVITVAVIGGTMIRAFKALLFPIQIVTGAFGLLRIASSIALTAIIKGAGVAKIALFAMLHPLKALKIGMLALARATLLNPLFLVGAAIVGTLVAAFFIFEDEIKSAVDALKGMGLTFDNIVTAGIAAVQTIIAAWRQFPAALADIGIQAANAIVNGVESGINGAINLLNKIPTVDIELVNFGEFENRFAGSAASIATIFKTTFDKIKAEGGGIAVVKKNFQDLLETFKAFTATPVDPALLNLTPTVSGGVPDSAAAIEALKGKFQSLLASISPLAKADFALAKAQDTINDAFEKGIDLVKKYGLTSKEIMARVTRDVIGVGNAASDLKEKQILLNRAWGKGIITLKELNDQTNKNRIEFLDSQTDMAAGVERFFLKMQTSAEDTATQVEEALTNAFQSAEDALIKFLETGKLSFSDFVSSILADITRLAFRQTVTQQFAGLLGIGGGGGGGLLASLFGGGAGIAAGPGQTATGFATGRGGLGPGGLGTPSGGGGNILDKAIGGVKSLFGFTQGGSFQIGGVGGIDRNILSVNDRPVARVSRGETVNVSPSGAAAGTGVNIVFNVSTPDANSFQRSQGQIMSKIGSAINRAQQRNS